MSTVLFKINIKGKNACSATCNTPKGAIAYIKVNDLCSFGEIVKKMFLYPYTLDHTV